MRRNYIRLQLLDRVFQLIKLLLQIIMVLCVLFQFVYHAILLADLGFNFTNFLPKADVLFLQSNVFRRVMLNILLLQQDLKLQIVYSFLQSRCVAIDTFIIQERESTAYESYSALLSLCIGGQLFDLSIEKLSQLLLQSMQTSIVILCNVSYSYATLEMFPDSSAKVLFTFQATDSDNCNETHANTECRICHPFALIDPCIQSI